MVRAMTGQADCPHNDYFEALGHYVCRCGERLAPIGYTRVVTSDGAYWMRFKHPRDIENAVAEAIQQIRTTKP